MSVYQTMSVAVVLIVISCLCHQLPEAFAQKTITLPKELKLCKSGDDVCLLDAISSAFKLMRNGLPSLGVKPLDPIHIDSIDSQGGATSIGVKSKLNNVDAYGIAVMKITSAKGEFSDKTYRLEMKGMAPKIFMLSDYVTEGKVLNIPFGGKGKGNLTYNDVEITVTLIGKIVKKKDGVEYVKIEDCKIHFTAQRGHIYLSNLFGGNKLLTESLNEVFNDNWKLLFNELKPSVEKDIGKVVKDVAFKFYDNVPYRMLHLV